MSKQSRCRQLTGCIRRAPKRHVSSYRRTMHLSHGNVIYRRNLQEAMILVGTTALSALRSLSPLLIIICILLRNHVNPVAPEAVTAINFILQLQGIRYISYNNKFLQYLDLDHRYHDIPLEEEENHPGSSPRRDIRFNSWSDQDCYDYTSFNKNQLQRIYHHFGLAQLAAQNGGYIRISNGHECHRFNPEELFLFLMTKCKTGDNNRMLFKNVFGGHQARWSYGFPWLLSYLDARYEDVIGHQNLIRYVDQFPAFFDAIQEKVRQRVTHHNHDGTAEEFTGLRFLPFGVFSLIDCKEFLINLPFSGPDGDYIGAPRKPRFRLAQRAMYNRHHHSHAVKVETVKLPNGISTMYGPVSCRPHDVGGVLQMSRLDQLLFDIQRDEEHMYSAFGDSPYGANYLRCIRSYFRAYGAGAHLTEYQRICNKRMSAIRECIEHCYGDIGNIFQLSMDSRNFKLAKRHPYVQQQVRVVHLLTNIYVCLNGDKMSGGMNCPPPTLDEYLDFSWMDRQI